MLCVKSNLLVVLQMRLHMFVLSMVRERDPFGWTMYTALGLSPDFSTVLPILLVHTTVPTLRMLALAVKFSVRKLPVSRITARVVTVSQTAICD